MSTITHYRHAAKTSGNCDKSHRRDVHHYKAITLITYSCRCHGTETIVRTAFKWFHLHRVGIPIRQMLDLLCKHVYSAETDSYMWEYAHKLVRLPVVHHAIREFFGGSPQWL